MDEMSEFYEFSLRSNFGYTFEGELSAPPGRLESVYQKIKKSKDTSKTERPANIHHAATRKIETWLPDSRALGPIILMSSVFNCSGAEQSEDGREMQSSGSHHIDVKYV